MKPYRFLLIALFSFSFISSNGQFFAGGNIQLNSSNAKTRYANDLTHDAANFSFTVSPIIGTFLSEKLALGLELNLALSRNKTGVSTETISKNSTIGGSPFIRYYAWTRKKFSVFGQGNVGLEFIRSSQEQGNSTIDGPKETRVYVSIYPGLSYDLTDKLSFQTSLNFLSIGYNYFTSKDDSFRESSSSFNFGTGLGNIISIGSITIGAIYKF